MYRYSNRTTPRQDSYQNKVVERIKGVVILLLVAAMVALAIFALPAIQYKKDANELYLARIQVECADAIELTAALSRTSGGNTSEQLGQIRSRVYAMETINSLSVGLNGPSGRFIEESWFTVLYGEIDTYTQKVAKGTATGDSQTSLYNSLGILFQQLEQY